MKSLKHEQTCNLTLLWYPMMSCRSSNFPQPQWIMCNMVSLILLTSTRIQNYIQVVILENRVKGERTDILEFC